MQRASGDAIVNLIEQIFWERQKIWMAVYERKNGTGICTFTGGEGSGHCRVPDPTAAQIDYAERLMIETGYDAYDVRDMYGKEFDELTRGEMARFIDMMKAERDG